MTEVKAMAKITVIPGIKLKKGALESVSIASIKQPSRPLIISKNQYGANLQNPYYTREKPRGKQEIIRQRYKNCARLYSDVSQEDRTKLRLEALAWNAAHPGRGPLTAYTMWMKECLEVP